MAKKNILIVCPQPADKRELNIPFFKENYNFIFPEYDAGVLDKIICGVAGHLPESFLPDILLKQLSQLCKEQHIDAITSTDDYPGSILASILSKELNLPGAATNSVLICQHKFYCREQQKIFVANATPHYTLIDPKTFTPDNFSMEFPVFLKPVKSYFSILSNKVSNRQSLSRLISASLPPELFLKSLNFFLKNYSTYPLTANYVLAEEYLSGHQVTLEGYVYNHQTHLIGIVDSIMFPETFSFQRFDYPSSLPIEIQNRMFQIAKDFIQGIGLNNSIFNIELMYNERTDTISIIEVNPRMSAEFADLFEKVDGINSYEILVDLALGEKPKTLIRDGQYSCASSFILRIFNNKEIVKTPNLADLKNFYQQFPDARVDILVKEGDNLNNMLQDGKSYRYGVIHLGGTDKKNLFDNFEQSKQLLPFQFK